MGQWLQARQVQWRVCKTSVSCFRWAKQCHTFKDKEAPCRKQSHQNVAMRAPITHWIYQETKCISQEHAVSFFSAWASSDAHDSMSWCSFVKDKVLASTSDYIRAAIKTSRTVGNHRRWQDSQRHCEVIQFLIAGNFNWQDGTVNFDRTIKPNVVMYRFLAMLPVLVE